MAGRRNGKYGRRRRNSFRNREDINPLDYLANLSDVMLVLAVGIMLSLILHWKVDLSVIEQENDTQSNEVVTFTNDELEKEEEIPESATQAGQVYYDSETDTYYIVNEPAQ